MQGGTHGFWRGVFSGILVVLLVALALAWFYPPLRAPELDDGIQIAPEPPAAPAGAGGARGPMLTPAPGPIVEGVGTAPAPPRAPGTDPAAGAPSLVPAQ
jgi:hypothetical protein